MKAHTTRVTEVSITLSEYEALVLMKVLANVGGPSAGPRGVIDDLYDTLRAQELDESVFIGSPEGEVYFK